VMTVRFETDPEPADEQSAALVAMTTTSDLDQVQIMQGEPEQRLWQQVAVDFPLISDAEHTLIVKASVLPTDVGPWLEDLEKLALSANLSKRWRAHVGHGLIFVRLAGDDVALVTAVEQLRQAATLRQGNLVVLDAPPDLARQVDVWGPGQALELMRRLKVRFDPNYTLNPGRFVGGI